MTDQLKNEAGNAEMKNLLSKNASVNLVAKVFYMITRFFLPPLTLSYVTLEEYGIWAACFILIGYLGMSAFGVSNVYIRYVAEFHARKEIDQINRLLSTGLTVIAALGVVLWGLHMGFSQGIVARARCSRGGRAKRRFRSCPTSCWAAPCGQIWAQ